MKPRFILLTVTACALFAVAGCSSPSDDGTLPTTANVANNSPEAQNAGAAPLINPDVPPPGKPIKAAKKDP